MEEFLALYDLYNANYHQFGSSSVQNEWDDQFNPEVRLGGDNSDSDTSSNMRQQLRNYNSDYDRSNEEALNLKNGDVYSKQCRYCTFTTSWESELRHHESRVHANENQEKKKAARPIPNLIPIQNSSKSNQSSGDKKQELSEKDLNDIYAKSCPNSALKDFASLIGGVDVFNTTVTDSSYNDNEVTNDSINSNSSSEETKKSPELFKKKNASFFDKLKERLMTTTANSSEAGNNLHCKYCSHISKCLSEYIIHQKLHANDSTISNTHTSQPNSNTGSPIHNGGSASTRCQFCRQRCKSSSDLLIHLQICTQALHYEEQSSQHSHESSNDISSNGQKYQNDKDNEDDDNNSKSKVFVWNEIPCETTLIEDPDPETEPEQETSNLEFNNSQNPSIEAEVEDKPNQSYDDIKDDSWRSKSPSESSLMGFETTPGYGSVTSKTKSGSHGHINPDPAPDQNGGPSSAELTLKKVYKCPHCAFWASTASRFHVHIVGHLNKKPFECSLCAYRSNWRWDITKHIRLKTIRDPAHEAAKVLMTDETGRRNYTKYNKYLTLMKVHEPNAESSGSGKRSNQQKPIPNINTNHNNLNLLTNARMLNLQPNILLNLTENQFKRPAPSSGGIHDYINNNDEPHAKIMKKFNNNNNESGNKKTMWKCKKCLFRDGDRSVVLAHVKEHWEHLRVSSLNKMNDSNVDPDSGVHDLRIESKIKEEVAENNNNNNIEETTKSINEDEDQEFVLYCEMCDFKTTSSSDYESHLTIHYPRETETNVSYRCYKCTFSSMSKSTLMEHLQSHGIQDVRDFYFPYDGRNLPKPPVITSEIKKFKCVLCPYVSNNKSQYDHHRRFHYTSGGPYQCSICSYNVSKRHLLHQHLRVHGINVPQLQTSKTLPSYDETAEETTDTPADICGTDTSGYKEIPLVWVSRQGTISKMHKCRFCPHVNVRKSNIQEHEKMHSERTPKLLADGTTAPPLQQHFCPDCNYVCNNAGVLSSHAKVHQGMFGTVCAMYDSARSDEEQIEAVMTLVNSSNFRMKQVVTSTDNETIETTPDISAILSQNNNGYSSDHDEDMTDNAMKMSESNLQYKMSNGTNGDDVKVLHFCTSCPARFLYEKELIIHGKFHTLQLSHKCLSCSYTARQEQHLLAHYKVHTDEYQERTKSLLSVYGESSKHPRNKTAVILDNPGMAGYIWVVVNDSSQYVPTPFSLNFNINNTIINNGNKKKDKVKKTPTRVITKQYSCTKCPAQFFKSVALQYHLTLHGGTGPHKCRSCDYAVKTYGNLIKHEQVHESLAPRVKCKLVKPVKKETPSPVKAFAKPEYHLKNIDPEFGFLMLGNPNFNYPTYIKNGKVKTKRYKCHKCPSAFEKREQYKVHLSLHGAQQKYKCDKCDYSVKYYANYIQHIRKHEKSESFNDLMKTENEQPIVNIDLVDSNAEKNLISQFQEQFHLCKFCPYASSRPEALKNHIKRHHTKETNVNNIKIKIISNQPEVNIKQEPIDMEDKLWNENVLHVESELNVQDYIDTENDVENGIENETEFEDEYDDEEIEKKFVMSSMMNGQAKHMEEYEEDDIEQDNDEYKTVNHDGYLVLDEGDDLDADSEGHLQIDESQN